MLIEQKKSDVTAVILAGGRALRMGGVQKALQVFQQRRLLDWVIERLLPQVDKIIININVSPQLYLDYANFFFVNDLRANFLGPLAGIEAACAHCQSEYLAVVPCDAPNIPVDLVERLMQALIANPDRQLAVAESEGILQPTYLLFNTSLYSSLSNCLDHEKYSIKSWIEQTNHLRVDFSANFFVNINSFAQLSAAE